MGLKNWMRDVLFMHIFRECVQRLLFNKTCTVADVWPLVTTPLAPKMNLFVLDKNLHILNLLKLAHFLNLQS